MRRLLTRNAAPLLAALFLACASGSNDADAPPRAQSGPPRAQSGPPIGVTFRQVSGSRELYRNPGQVGLRYIVTITNPSAEPFVVDRIEVRSPVPGAYAVRDTAPVRINRTIPPKMGINLPVDAWGIAVGGRGQMDEPVTIAVIVYGSGADQKPVVKRVQRTLTEFHEE